MRPAFSLVLVLASTAVAAAGEFRGTAVKLDNTPIPTLNQLTVQVLSEQGAVLNTVPSVVDPATGQYTVRVDNAELVRQGVVTVNLFFQAPGQESVTLTNIRGSGVLTIDVVMPDLKPMCAVSAPTCCCLSKTGIFSRVFKR